MKTSPQFCFKCSWKDSTLTLQAMLVSYILDTDKLYTHQ